MTGSRRIRWRNACARSVPDTHAPAHPASFPCLAVPVAVRAEDAFACWSGEAHVAWLDSGGPIGPRSRFSYLAVEPFQVLGGNAPWREMEALMGRYRQPSWPAAPLPAQPPFTGGAVGFIGYEAGALVQGVAHHVPADMPPSAIGFYDLVFAFDRATGKAWLLSSGLPETRAHLQRTRARARADAALARLACARQEPPTPPALAWQAEAARAVHEARVARTLAYIAAGDIYQANITAAFHAERPGWLTAASIHLALRAASPAPYGAFIGAGDGSAVASVSPERFIGLDSAGGIEARPIKGTRARDDDPARDAALLAELLASDKDRAENLMIVDLLRHDISQVADIGSVHVPELAVAESFARVHHLVSSVRGRLRGDASATSLLRACFPPGSITGAPKHRAMQIIHELEPAARGPYCGAVFWLGWDGAMDSAVTIRTAVITPGRVILQAGGGIVADSDPALEYEEMLVKVGPLLRASAEKVSHLF